MDRKQVVMQRTREIFGERLEDVMHMVRQNREGLRGCGRTCAAVREVLRRGIRERANAEPENGGQSTMVVRSEIGRCAGEPDRGQQRESLGQLLEAGATRTGENRSLQRSGLEREEGLGLECVLLIHGRPALLVNQDRLRLRAAAVECSGRSTGRYRGGPARCRTGSSCSGIRNTIGPAPRFSSTKPRCSPRAGRLSCSSKTRAGRGSSGPASPRGWITAPNTRACRAQATACGA